MAEDVSVRLTQYSHGAGCGCKISPKDLDVIVQTALQPFESPGLLVGSGSRDDAAVFDLGQGEGVISTTDFFMPIVDDPFDFGRVAATNAISDVYAMGGTPLMAVAILGWPIKKLGAEIARQVVDGGRRACHGVGIPMAGGHSIDAPEPIFGLAVTGRVKLSHLKRNDTANVGDRIFLTKPLGVGILTTAQKKGQLDDRHQHIARDTMCQPNSLGELFGSLSMVTAMTDVTGFGLLGHLLEVCEGSAVGAVLYEERIPLLPHVATYLDRGCIPGGSGRNFASYGCKLADLSLRQRNILCDPQTSGGLLVTVKAEQEQAFVALARQQGLDLTAIGECVEVASDADTRLIAVTA